MSEQENRNKEVKFSIENKNEDKESVKVKAEKTENEQNRQEKGNEKLNADQNESTERKSEKQEEPATANSSTSKTWTEQRKYGVFSITAALVCGMLIGACAYSTGYYHGLIKAEKEVMPYQIEQNQNQLDTSKQEENSGTGTNNNFGAIEGHDNQSFNETIVKRFGRSLAVIRDMSDGSTMSAVLVRKNGKTMYYATSADVSQDAADLRLIYQTTATEVKQVITDDDSNISILEIDSDQFDGIDQDEAPEVLETSQGATISSVCMIYSKQLKDNTADNDYIKTFYPSKIGPTQNFLKFASYKKGSLVINDQGEAVGIFTGFYWNSNFFWNDNNESNVITDIDSVIDAATDAEYNEVFNSDDDTTEENTSHGYLGITCQDAIDSVSGESKGALILEVAEDSDAAKKGLQAGDVIVGVDEESVTTATDLVNKVKDKEVGDTVSIIVMRKSEDGVWQSKFFDISLVDKDALSSLQD